MLIVFTTTPSTEEAELLAQKIVEARLAACVQILPQMTSVYVWEGKLQKEGEHLLLIKTLPEKWDELHEFIVANHSYDVPEIVAVDAARVSAHYRAWLTDVLTDSGERAMES
ncbi:MAG: divalent-cation tolerance protein CutA [Pyrinomonadaceae bacterium]